MVKTTIAKKGTSRRLDKNRITLKVGESQRANGTYSYRWTSADGKRHDVYANSLEELRAKEELVVVDSHDGIKTETRSITVNDMFDQWCELKRGIKDNTLQNYKYMYNMFVRPRFGRIKLVQVKRSDVKRFYNTMADEKILKISTIDNVHNILHQVFDFAMNDNIIRVNPTDNM